MKKILFGLMLMSSCACFAQPLLFAAKEKGKKYGYIDSSGKYVIEPSFDEALAFNEGYAVVKLGEKYGVINTSGDFVLKPTFDKARMMVSEGKLSVWSNETQSWGSVRMDGTMVIDQDSGLGYLSSYYGGKVLGAQDVMRDYMVMIVFDSVGQYTFPELYMVISQDKKDKSNVTPSFFDPKIRSGRLQSYNSDTFVLQVTDVEGQVLAVNPTYFSQYREGLMVGEAANGQIPYYRVADASAQPEFDSLERKIEPLAFQVRGEVGYPFFNGIAAIEQDGVWAFIDNKGTVVSKTKLSTKEYSAGPPMYFAGLVGLFKGNKAGYINLKGEVVIPFEFSEYHPFEYDVAPVQKGKKYGLLKKDGTWAVEPKFDDLNVGTCPCFR